MKKFDVLQRAAGQVSGLIASRTPNARTASVAAYELLGKAAASVEGFTAGVLPPESFQLAINDIINGLEAFRSGVASNMGETMQKTFTPTEFAAHFDAEIVKVLAEPVVPALRKLYALQKAIAAAIGEIEKAGPGESESSFSFPVTKDPAQLTPTETQMSAASLPTSAGASQTVTAPPATVGTGTVPVTPSVQKSEPDAASIMSGTADKIEKASVSKEEEGSWSMDLASKEFLTGVRKCDFGKDRSKV